MSAIAHSTSGSDDDMRGTPFPHNADSPFYPGEVALNADHLVSERVFYGPDSDASVIRTGFYSPHTGSALTNLPNGRFSFQIPQSRKLLLSVKIQSHRVAKEKGGTVSGYSKDPFYAFNSGFNRRLLARNIRTHKYAVFDIVHVVKPDDGSVLAQGNAGYLDAVFSDVAFAIQKY